MVVNDSVFRGGGAALDGHAKSILPAGFSVTPDETHTDFLRHSDFQVGFSKCSQGRNK